MDITGASDPQCQIYQNGFRLGYTEIQPDTSDPDFLHSIGMDYFFHQDQRLELRFVDNDEAVDMNKDLASGE